MANDIIDPLVEEETDLALHTKLCAQRYQRINDSFTRIDSRLDKMESTLVEIKEVISKDTRDNYKMYLAWASGLITVLVGSTGFLLAHFVFK